MTAKSSVSLRRVATGAGERAGTVWTLAESEESNANLVRFHLGRGVVEHVNDEVDVLLVGVSGSGEVAVDGEEHTLSAGILVFAPKGTRRAIRSASEDFACPGVHRRRGALRIGRGRKHEAEGGTATP